MFSIKFKIHVANVKRRSNLNSIKIYVCIALSHDDITAQATIFFIAGFETSSTAISFACLEMAVNNDVQRKAQLEIDEVLSNHDGKLTYDALKEMKYLDCVIQGL